MQEINLGGRKNASLTYLAMLNEMLCIDTSAGSMHGIHDNYGVSISEPLELNQDQYLQVFFISLFGYTAVSRNGPGAPIRDIPTGSILVVC